MGKMTVDELAMALWQEQIELGIGEPGEVASEDNLSDWWRNRTEPMYVYEDAADGDVAALVRVRAEAGLPVLR